MAGIPMASGLPLLAAESDTDWPGFRGAGGIGVSDGYPLPGAWNADAATGKLTGIRWKTPVPGLGHSSPIVLGNRIYVCSAARRFLFHSATRS